MTGRGYRQSAEVAAAMGPYQRYAENREPHNEVMRKHQAAAYEIGSELVPEDLIGAARRSWDEAVPPGEDHRYPHTEATRPPPTATIALPMDRQTPGIQPASPL